MVNNGVVKKTLLLVLLVALIQSTAPLVKADPVPKVIALAPYSGPQPNQPYAAGYFDIPSDTTTAAQITVSFPNTNPEVIPWDNYIAGSMFLQGQGSIDRTDYGYLASLSLDYWGTVQYNMAFYVTFEGREWPPELPWYSRVWDSAVVLGVVPSKPVTLTMQWNGDWVEWLYTIDGNTYLADSFNVRGYSSAIQNYFHIGWHHEPGNPGSDWSYFYQFGLYSKYDMQNGGWKVRLERPKYYDASISRFRTVYKARGITGPYSFMDHWWCLGGDFYSARARYYNSYTPLPWKFLLEFDWIDYPDYLYDGQLLWDHPADAPETPSTPSGPSSGYKYTSYTYTTSTFDPNNNLVRYQFDWGDGSSTWTGYYSSGATASASHKWSSIGAYPIRVRAKDSTGLYSDWSYDKRMNIINKPGGGCPTLFGWDGSEHVEVGVLNIHSDSDITFMQGIVQTLVSENHFYKLSLRELDEFTSHIDYVKLYAVDNDVNKYELNLVQAVHNELGQVIRLLIREDGRRVDLSPQQTIDLKFTVPNINRIAYFIFEINGYNRKIP